MVESYKQVVLQQNYANTIWFNHSCMPHTRLLHWSVLLPFWFRPNKLPERSVATTSTVMSALGLRASAHAVALASELGCESGPASVRLSLVTGSTMVLVMKRLDSRHFISYHWHSLTLSSDFFLLRLSTHQKSLHSGPPKLITDCLVPKCLALW